ncbi:AMP-binding protein [Pseudonocardia sp. D17]|uniref:AMP-binding protein n=1 Tax=Pseudonocardia sp. D17 TaxID=882661 RepID=UPI002B39BA6F|nr:ATP-dependent acyl-CoA ligase [Pseudonocardia sp. D17]
MTRTAQPVPTRPRRLRDSGWTLHGILAAAAAAEPDRPAVEFTGARGFTTAELHEAVGGMAATLRARGIGRGDRVALLVGNRPEFLTTFLACSALGAVAVPLNTALRGRALAETLRQFLPCPLVTEAALAPNLTALTGDAAPTALWSVDALPGAHRLEPAAEPVMPAPDIQPWDVATILLTSGTTGLSKGVMWSHATALTFADTSTWVMGYTADDVIHTCLPLFHINALLTALVPGLLTGAKVVVAPRFGVRTFWSDLADCGATVTNMMGAMGALLWRQEPTPAETAHRLRLAMVLPLPADRHEFERRFGVPTTEVYGSTDTGMPIGIPFGERRPGSCGKPAPGFAVDLVDADDEPVGPGELGELVTRPTVAFAGTLGYWRNPEHTAQVLRNQWFHTGDLLRRDDEGWYYYVDRGKDALRVSGENVSSVEVERALLRHPDVAEAAVFGLPGEFGEDAVAAAVVPRPGRTVDPAQLRAFVTPDLPYFAVPRYLDVRESLPRTATEKVRKAELRAEGLRPGMWDGGPSRRL